MQDDDHRRLIMWLASAVSGVIRDTRAFLVAGSRADVIYHDLSRRTLQRTDKFASMFLHAVWLNRQTDTEKVDAAAAAVGFYLVFKLVDLD